MECKNELRRRKRTRDVKNVKDRPTEDIVTRIRNNCACLQCCALTWTNNPPQKTKPSTGILMFLTIFAIYIHIYGFISCLKTCVLY